MNKDQQIIKTTIPLKEDLLIKILSKDDEVQKYFYIIDVENSIENLDKIVYYITNLQLNCDLDLSNICFEDRVKLLLQYLNTNINITNINVLTYTLVDILLVSKGLNPTNEGMFTQNQCLSFLRQHKHLINDIINFLDSIVLYYWCCQQGFSDDNIKQYHEMFNVNNNRLACPPNVLHVLNCIDFVDYYSVIDLNRLTYYPKQFETPMFGGEGLDKWVFCENNLISAYMSQVYLGK